MDHMTDKTMVFIIKEKLDALLQNRPSPPLDELTFPAKYTGIIQTINSLIEDLSEIRQSVLDLADGRLDGFVPSRRNYLAAPIKRLQSQLSILEWNTTQLASGKIVSKINSPGQLFQAFNKTVDTFVDLSTKSGNGEDLSNVESTNASSWRFHQILLALNKINAMVIETNSQGEIVYANQPATAYLGSIRQINIESAEARHSDVLTHLAYAIRNGETFPIFKELCESATGQWFKITTDQFKLAEDQAFFVHMIDDISEWKRHEQELSESANLDSMTQVYNLRAGLEATQAALGKMSKGDVNCIVFVDLDGLKEVNDTYGHQAGDVFIKSVASAISRSIRQSDIIARYGGDEFFIFFEKCSEADGELKMRRIKEKLLQMKEKQKIPFDMDFSYGIYPFTLGADLDIAEIINNADNLMYQRKRKKKQKE